MHARVKHSIRFKRWRQFNLERICSIIEVRTVFDARDSATIWQHQILWAGEVTEVAMAGTHGAAGRD